MSLPAALTYLYTSADEIADLLSQDGVDLRLDDNADDVISSPELARLTSNAVNYATSRVNLFLACRYGPAQLVNSWQVHNWCTVIAATWLARRRGNPCPDSLLKMAEAAEAEMLSVREHQLDLTDIQERESPQIAVSNSRLDSRFTVKQLRRERALSDPRPSVIPPTVDYPSDVIASSEDFQR